MPQVWWWWWADLVGEGAAQEQAVVGETPNPAARLQALAALNQVVIAEATRRLLGAGFDLEDLGPQALKGIAEPVMAFAVTRERPTPAGSKRALGRRCCPWSGVTRSWRACANEEAIGYLRQAIELNRLRAAGIERDHAELALLLSLVPATRVIKSYTTHETLELYTRAHELIRGSRSAAEQMNRAPPAPR